MPTRTTNKQTNNNNTDENKEKKEEIKRSRDSDFPKPWKRAKGQTNQWQCG